MTSTASIFTGAESRLLLICFKHMEGVPNINWDAVAEEYGYKNGALARSKFSIAKSKCKLIKARTNTAAEVTASESKTAGAKLSKRKADDDATSSVAKRGRGRPRTNAEAVKPTIGDDSIDVVPVVKTDENTPSEGYDEENEVNDSNGAIRFNPINKPHTGSDDDEA